MLKSILSGLVGAATLTLAHQALQKVRPDAPRMDIYGKRGIGKALEAAGLGSLSEDKLFKGALIGDILTNTMYFSQVGDRPGVLTWLRGLALGVTAGLGALSLGPALGLGNEPSRKTTATMLMTVGLYTLGGLAAAAAVNACPVSKD